jgi:hypothetical protein
MTLQMIDIQSGMIHVTDRNDTFMTFERHTGGNFVSD